MLRIFRGEWCWLQASHSWVGLGYIKGYSGGSVMLGLVLGSHCISSLLAIWRTGLSLGLPVLARFDMVVSFSIVFLTSLSFWCGVAEFLQFPLLPFTQLFFLSLDVVVCFLHHLVVDFLLVGVCIL